MIHCDNTINIKYLDYTYSSFLDISDIFTIHVTLSSYREYTVPSTTKMSFFSGHLITESLYRFHKCKRAYVEKRIRARKNFRYLKFQNDKKFMDF